MQETCFNLAARGVLEALCNDTAMRCWQRMRVRDTPLPAVDIGQDLGISLRETDVALDLLQAAGLVRKLPAGRGRRIVTYEITTDAIVAVSDVAGEESRKRFLDLADAQRRREELILSRAKAIEERVPGEWFFNHVSEFDLTRDEIKELQRRIYEVSRYLLELADRTRGRAKPPGHGSGLAVQLRVFPVCGASAAFPRIRLLTPQAVTEQNREKLPTPDVLAPRERAVAKLLQEGKSRAEAAAALGISAQTVSTHCKRVFAKLGIKRVVELGRFDLGGAYASRSRRSKRGA